MADILITAQNLIVSLVGKVVARLTPLMWSVNDRLSSSLMVCWALVPAVPLTEIFPLFVSSLKSETKYRTLSTHNGCAFAFRNKECS